MKGYIQVGGNRILPPIRIKLFFGKKPKLRKFVIYYGSKSFLKMHPKEAVYSYSALSPRRR